MCFIVCNLRGGFGGRRIRATRRIVHIASFTIVQVDKARRLSVHWKYYVSLHIISLSVCACLYCVGVLICVCYVYSFTWCLRTSLEDI